jgi:teichuronic acid biosynthesis glycosyltransferase TuaC
LEEYYNCQFETISAGVIKMKLLIVCSGNAGQVSPFVHEQVESIKKLGVEFEYYNVLGRGVLGYLRNVGPLRVKIRSYHPDLIHSHYGLSGLLSLIVKGRAPLITTFHGNDINTLHPLNKLKPNWNKILSGIVYFFCNHSIFVTENIANQIKAKPSKSDIIPCQVNLDTFYPVDKTYARQQLKLSPTKNYVLFSSSFRTYIKNYPLAKLACLNFENLELLELRGFTRPEVNMLINACDLALITSYNEGSNQFLKEAMSCNCPVVSTKVGDAEWIFGKTSGCFITSFEPQDVVEKINLALEFGKKYGQTRGRERIIYLGLDSVTTAQKIMEVYQKVLETNDDKIVR